MRLIILCLLAPLALPLASPAQDVPVFVVSGPATAITFAVSASVPIHGTFDKWDATLTFTSTDVTTGVLRITVRAASVNTGSGLKNNTLKGEDFFNVERDPLITFVSKRVVQTGPETLEIQGDFTIRGVTKPETLLLTVSGKGTGSGQIKGTMAFDRKEFGMNSGIPFIRIADRVEVTVALEGKRVSGPPLVFRQ
jgi:polyisoprenoid-binding protein YceI